MEVEYEAKEKEPIVKRYAIQNKTKYNDITYYTITKEKSNKKVDIKFDIYDNEEKVINYMLIESKKAKLPKDVYDIVIDAGHGGSDNGAEANGYKEADLTLKYAKKVKQELEKLGLKVKMTRDGTENEETFGVQTVYNEGGRVNITGDSKAKFVFSIHLNSIQKANSQSGVEIYTATRMNLDLAKAFARNIVKYGKTTYSDLEANYKQAEGVYVRTFKDWEIAESMQDAKKGGYEAYDIKEYTPYLYMLRETGGIATGAYVDRKKQSLWN